MALHTSSRVDLTTLPRDKGALLLLLVFTVAFHPTYTLRLLASEELQRVDRESTRKMIASAYVPIRGLHPVF